MLCCSDTSVGEICLKSCILAQAAGSVLPFFRGAQLWAVITSLCRAVEGELCAAVLL